MIPKQIVKKHWINSIFISMGLFLIIYFFLSFAAEGRMLEINDQYCSGSGERVVFDVTISRNSSEPMEDFGFTVKYDDNILEYVRSSSSLIVRQYSDRFSCHGDGEDIDGYVHKLGQLVFDVKKCEGTTLKLLDLSGGLAGWSTSEGHLKVKGESASAPSVSGCVYPNCPGQGYTISGFTYKPYTGYLGAGFFDARSYSPVFQNLGFPGSGFLNLQKSYYWLGSNFPGLEFNPYSLGVSYFSYPSLSMTWPWNFYTYLDR